MACTAAERERLILDHLDLPCKLQGQYKWQVPRDKEADLYAAGTLALVAAAVECESTEGFGEVAYRRVRYAMKDFFRREQRAAVTTFYGAEPDGRGGHEVVDPQSGDGIAAIDDQDEIEGFWRWATKHTSPRSLAVLQHRFKDGWSVTKIARQLGITQGRVSQICGSTVKAFHKLQDCDGAPSELQLRLSGSGS